jgi:hypothetical protein
MQVIEEISKDSDLGSAMSLIKITASNLYFALQYYFVLTLGQD